MSQRYVNRGGGGGIKARMLWWKMEKEFFGKGRPSRGVGSFIGL